MQGGYGPITIPLPCPPHHHPPLPYTGYDIGVAVCAAVALIIIGLALLRASKAFRPR